MGTKYTEGLFLVNFRYESQLIIFNVAVRYPNFQEVLLKTIMNGSYYISGWVTRNDWIFLASLKKEL